MRAIQELEIDLRSFYKARIYFIWKHIKNASCSSQVDTYCLVGDLQLSFSHPTDHPDVEISIVLSMVVRVISALSYGVECWLYNMLSSHDTSGRTELISSDGQRERPRVM